MDAGRPGQLGQHSNFENCANNRACAEKAVVEYAARFGRDCNGDGKIDCEDFAILHKTGPERCNVSQVRSLFYWKAFQNTQCAVSSK